jgi:putative transposase
MPRTPRLVLPGIPLHVVQRGNDRKACFRHEHDRLLYLDELRTLCRDAQCAVHAYVLMTNHVHLLMTPNDQGGIGRLMQALGRRYVRHFNDRYQRTGTLWEGRYRAGPVDGEAYLLRCHRYIELNPVRAGMVAVPGDYRWSSYVGNALGEDDSLLTPHAAYFALGADSDERQRAYRDLVAEAVPDHETAFIRQQLQRQHVLGDAPFRKAIEAVAARRVGPGTIGRPKKERGGGTSPPPL